MNFRFQILIVLAVLLISSAARGECVTACGVRFSEGSCTLANWVEGQTLDAFERNGTGWIAMRACKALRGWRVYVHTYTESDADCREGFKIKGLPACYDGVTHPDTRSIELRNTDWDNADLSHEMAHALQVEFSEPIGHCFWGARGIERAIYQATGAIDGQLDGPCGPVLKSGAK